MSFKTEHFLFVGLSLRVHIANFFLIVFDSRNISVSYDCKLCFHQMPAAISLLGEIRI